MKRLCFGSYIKVLRLCKSATGKSQKNICGTVILSLNPVGYDIRTDDTTTSDLVLCRANLTQSVIDLASKVDTQADKNALCEYFKASVLRLIDSNKKSDVVLALKDIIANDTHIKPDTIVDKIAGLSKAALSETDTFVFEDFIAGIFLYTATVVENTEGKYSVKTIDKDYMSQFIGRENEVKFVDKIDYSHLAKMSNDNTSAVANEPAVMPPENAAPRKLGQNDLVELFENAIDKYGVAKFVDTDFTATPLFMVWVSDMDDFVNYLREVVLPKFRHISREKIYGYCVDFVNIISAYNGYLGTKMMVTDDGKRATWLPNAGFEINEDTLNYRRELNRLYGLISGGGTLSVYGYTSADDNEASEDTHTSDNGSDNETKHNAAEDVRGQTVN